MTALSTSFRFSLLAALTVLPSLAIAAPKAEPPPDPVELSGPVYIGSIEELRQRVLDANWSIQGKMLEYEVKRRTEEAAKGAFDPALVAEYNYEDKARPNTVEQRRQLSGVPELTEQNHTGTTSLQTLTPLGSRLSLTASVSEFHNNLQRITTGGFGATGSEEVVTFVGVSLVQPLLKDAGKRTATAAIRVAACESEQAWQDFRRQLMVALSSAELAYWNVHGAVRQVEYMRQSVEVARKVAKDVKTLKEAGKAAPVEVAAAEAGIEDRLARLAAAEQKLVEAKAVLAGFCAASVSEGFDLNTKAPPPPSKVTPDASAGLASAYTSNPDYLGKVAEKDAEDIRADFMRNQKLPQLDLKASYGLNGLGTDFSRSADDIERTDYAAWGVGIEFKMPLGNREAKNRYAAALARKKRAEDTLVDVRTQISNAIDNAVSKVVNTRTALGSYYRAIALNQEVLNSRLVDQKEGKAEIRRVLEAEEDLSESKISAVSGLIQHRQALLEYELAAGVVLDNRSVTITKEEVVKRTAAMAKKHKVSSTAYEEFLGDVREAAERK
jgi:outer membrane protein TolC